jgi:hypothetical protein
MDVGYHVVKYSTHRQIFSGIIYRNKDDDLFLCRGEKGTGFIVEQLDSKEVRYMDYDKSDSLGRRASLMLRSGKSWHITAEAKSLLNKAIEWEHQQFTTMTEDYIA